MTPHSICPFNRKNIDRMTQILFDAFDNDPFMLWLVGGPSQYQNKGRPLIKTWVRYTMRYGYGLNIQDSLAAVMFKKPGDIKFGFWRIIRSGMLKTQSLLGKEGMQRLTMMEQQWDAKRKSIMGDQDYLYCWMLGTAPADQGKGCGTALMKAGFEQYPDVPCYLETQNEPNKRYYEKLGFQEKDRFQMDGADFPIICMVRAANNSITQP